ncbi:MAG: acyl-CoA dehydrogenase family protein [Proteobacteria bacterium]|nr:acyl-CoA dehydrogenase family protein [Pseudomonadota bacterium]
MTRPTITPAIDFYNFEQMLNDEQKMTIQSVRDFVRKKLSANIAKNYLNETFPQELIREFGDMGLLGSNLAGYGLPGLDQISYGLIMKELERCDSGVRSFASVQGALVMYPIHEFGSEAQKQEWLPKLGSGEAVGCFGLTESYGGSDPGAMKTTAELKSGKWLLNGSKMWITNGNLADVAVVWAKTAEGIRGFVVPTNTPGFTAKKMTGKLSLRASVTSELYFDQVELPESAMLPKSTGGLKCALSCLTQARYGIAWGVLGAAEACLEEVIHYVKDRVVFGGPLSSKQLIQAKIADMATRITQGQLLALRLGQLKEMKLMHHSQVSMAKQNNVKMALEVARQARDILGGNGIMSEYQSMRHMCNLETVYTYEGTNDIHLLIVGGEILGAPAL